MAYKFQQGFIRKSDLSGLFWTILLILFTVALVWQPGAVFEGALTGLKAWWEIVFPALLPFFIVSEMMMKLGVVKFVGMLLEPIMRPLFNVPGAGGVVMVMGFTSGTPVGAMVTAQLRRDGLCTRIEAERIISFTNNSSPLFMMTAIAVGMLHQPGLGIVIAGAHYLANLILGFCLRFYGRDQEIVRHHSDEGSSLVRAFKALLQHQRSQRESIMTLLGQAIITSIQNLLSMGGFIIIFAVLLKLLEKAGILSLIASLIGLPLIPLGFSPEILTSLAGGLFETTLGSKMATEAPVNQIQILLVIGIMLGWSGLAMHAMVAGLIAGTDIRMRPFILSRVAHAFLAAGFTGLLYHPAKVSDNVFPALTSNVINNSHSSWSVIPTLLMLMLVLLLVLLLLSMIIHCLAGLRRFVLKRCYKVLRK